LKAGYVCKCDDYLVVLGCLTSTHGMFYSVLMVMHCLPAHMCVPEVMQHQTSPISPSMLAICSSYNMLFGFVSPSGTFLQNFWCVGTGIFRGLLGCPWGVSVYHL